jgi:serine/threonine-protein kinase
MHPAINREFGNYVVRSLLGEGGMGAVFAAEHRFLGTRAAIKVLHGSFAGDPEVAQRFFHEAKASLQIGHPNVIRTLDFGQAESGELYLVMELLDGRNLRQTLAADGAFGEGACARLGAEIADGLAAAHTKGIVHRDLKPDNVFVTQTGEVKVIDFGIAKVAASSSGTKSGSVLGTPRYMAPEQAKGTRHVGTHTDVYALGLILFEMLTGQPPFSGDDVTELLAKHLFEKPVAPSTYAAVSEEMDALVLGCLAKEPEQRPASMIDVRDRLRAQIGVVSAARLGRPSPAVTPTPQTTLGRSAAEVVSLHIPTKRPPVALIFGVAAGVAVLLTLAVRGSRSTDQPPPVAVVAAKPVAPPVVAPPVVAPAVATPARAVTLRVLSEPSGADVYRVADGIGVGRTPLAQSIPAANGHAVYVLKLAGYEDQRIELAADHDGERTATLTRLRARAKTAAPASKPAKTRVRDGAVDPFE